MSFTPAPLQPRPQAFSLVSQLLGASSLPVRPLPVSRSAPAHSQLDRLDLKSPVQLFSAAVLPEMDLGGASPVQQLQQLGLKYGVPFRGGDMQAYQRQVIQTVITHKAREKGIPVEIALAIANNESGTKMWKNTSSAELVAGKNIRDGVLKSTDWGAMQINDKAHPRAFPRAKTDLEFNIDYGLSYLARQRTKVKGSLNLGFGDWDRTIASYNLGHSPQTERAHQIAQRYVGHVRKQADRLA